MTEFTETLPKLYQNFTAIVEVQMRYLIVVFLVGLFSVSLASAQGVVQLATERDAETGDFIDWAEIPVTWGSEVVTAVADHRGTDDDSLQEWYVPVAGGWLLFSFIRSQFGEYAVRWSQGGNLWSDLAVVVIISPGAAVHKD